MRRQRPAVGQHRLGALLLHDRGAESGKGTGTKSPALSSSNRPFSTSSRLSAPSRLICQSAPPPRQRYSPRAIVSVSIAGLGEALAERRRRVGIGLDQGLAERRVGEAAEADQLQPAAAEAEFVIAAKLVIILRGCAPGDCGCGRAGRRRERSDTSSTSWIETAAAGIDVEDRAVAEIAPERAGEPRLFAVDAEHLVAPVEDRAGRRRSPAPARHCRCGSYRCAGSSVNWVRRRSSRSAKPRRSSSRAGVRRARICGRQTKLPERPRLDR